MILRLWKILPNIVPSLMITSSTRLSDCRVHLGNGFGGVLILVLDGVLLPE